MNTIIPYNINQPNFTAFRPAKNVINYIHDPKNTGVSGILKPKQVRKNRFEKLKNSITEYFRNYVKRIKYTAKHKKAFLKVEKELTGKNTLSGYLHDSDKLLMYIIGVPKEVAHNIHVAIAPHHIRNGKAKNPVQTVIDWECARYTKPDKPLSAREYYETFYVKGQGIRIPEIEKVLDEFGM